MSAGAAFGAVAAGFGRALTGGPAVLALYLAGLVPSLLAALAVALPSQGSGAALADLLLGRPLDLNLVVEMGAAGSAEQLFGPGPGAPSAALPAFLASALLSGVLYAWVAGGVIARVGGGGGSFVDACNRWCWPFVRLWLLSLAMLFVAGVAAVFVAAVAPPAGLALLVAAVALLDTVFELARTGLAAGVTRGARGAVAAALGLFARSPAPWLLCLLLLPFSLAVLVAQWAIVGQGEPDVWSALAAAQLAALLAAFVKAWRLGAAMALWKSR